MPEPRPHRPVDDAEPRRPQTVSDRNQAYVMRFLGCLVGSLLFVIGIAYLPFYNTPDRIGWRIINPGVPLSLQSIQLQTPVPKPPAPPITVIRTEPEQEEAAEGDGTSDADSETEEQTLSEDVGTISEPAAKPLERLVLAHAEHMPTIRGGLGAYYINIRYPKAAVDAGIEGRLVLDFIVEPDGSISDISVKRSLHPLCDSAAVRALRQTYFMPGRQDGEAVPVRMRLPVVFKIVDRS